MKKIVFALLSAIPVLLHSQSAETTLDWCRTRARDNYPLIKQYGLIEDSRKYSMHIATSGYFPRVTVSGKETYQSDVTKVDIPIQGVSVDGLSRDQYQILGEISQPLWDGGSTASQRHIAEKSSAADRQKLESDLYAIDDRVNQLFFGILILDGQLAQNETLHKELDTNYSRVAACLENGIATNADLDEIRVEQLNADQKRTELITSRKAFAEMLSRMTGTEFGDDAVFAKPESVQEDSGAAAQTRPEYAYFAAQENLCDAQKEAAWAAAQPRLNAFFQAGFGKPGLNMLNGDAAPFWIGGVRFSWNLDSFYTLRSNLGKIGTAKSAIALQREVFAYNQNLAVDQQKCEIAKLRELIRTDEKIIALHTNIRKSAEIKVENGTMTVSDLIREINAENLAMQTKSLHEMQLLFSAYTLKYTLND